MVSHIRLVVVNAVLRLDLRFDAPCELGDGFGVIASGGVVHLSEPFIDRRPSCGMHVERTAQRSCAT